jgi:hypothetical protein
MRNTALLLFLLVSLISCRKETLEIQQTTDSDVYPSFNFNIESITSVDTVSVGSKINYNLYIRQQIVHIPGRKYFVSFRIPQAMDGEAIINDKPWRSGDIVMIEYDQVVRSNYRLPFSYTPRDGKATSYAIDFACYDEAGKTLSYSKNINVN